MEQAIYCLLRCGTPEGIRTPDPRIRSPMLYPAELLAQNTSGPSSLAGSGSAAYKLMERVMGIEPT